MESLINADHWLFAKINQDWSNGFFDWLFPNITDLHRSPWLLFIVLPLLAFWVWKKRSYAVKWILLTAVAVACSDLFCYRVIKSVTKRDRPEFTGIEVDLRTKRHSGSSFPSNHASNMFAAATMLSVATPPLAPVFFVIAISIAYSRVYVGVHFPVDVISGALIGTLIAFLILAIQDLIRKLRNRKIQREDS